MDISQEVKQVGLLVAKYGFIPVFKQMPRPAVPPVEVLGLPCQKFAHDGRDAMFATPEKEMDVVVHQHPDKLSLVLW